MYVGVPLSMEMIELKKVDFSFEDERGSLTQLVHCGYEQINVLFTRKGVERGGHFHKQSTECFYVVSGSVEVTASKDAEQKKYQFTKGDFFQVNPYVVHSMYFTDDCVMVAMYDKCVELDDHTKDIFPA